MFEIPVLVNIYRNKNRVKMLFDEIKKVAPMKLYIFQDGALTEEVEKQLDDCLNYAKGLIDWNCEVFTYRLDDDIGPAAAEYFAYKWMFETEDFGVILEDDCIPNESFFMFVETMLHRYKDNDKISYIAGTNPYGKYSTQYDYFFSTRGALYGWATWKRFIDELDPSYKWLDDNHIEDIMISKCCDRFSYEQIKKKSERLRKENKPDFEVMICMATVINDQYAVIPSHNLVMNCGVDATSENGAKALFLMPKSNQKQYYAERFPVTSFDKYPNEIAEENGYREIYNNSRIKRMRILCEIMIRRILYAIAPKKSNKTN